MSLILDALKRADADRERGAIPGLHSQPSPLPAGTLPNVRSQAALPWLVGAGALALASGAGWWLGTAGKTAPVAAPPPTPAVAAITPLATPAPAAIAPGPAMATATPPTDRAAIAPVQDDAPPAPKPAEVAPPPPKVGRLPAQASLAPASPPAEHRASPKAAPAPAKTKADSANLQHIPSADELPADIRQQLPKLAISGATYSQNPAHRMLIVQGQVYAEGDKLGTDWTLEQIGPKSVVLNFRGQRYQVSN